MPEVPVYGARRAVGPLGIDGVLDELSWALAPRVGAFRSIYDPSRPLKYHTEAAIVWDDDNLYVSFACADTQPWGRLTNRDDHLWNEEVVEVFLDPDGDGMNYAELEVSPHNVVVDLLVPRPRPAIEDAIAWDIEGLRTAVTRHAAGWIAEIAVPWTSLSAAGISAAPSPGDAWRVGLYRIKRPGGPEQPDGPDNEFTAWSLTRGDRGFHDPERFGIVHFLL